MEHAFCIYHFYAAAHLFCERFGYGQAQSCRFVCCLDRIIPVKQPACLNFVEVSGMVGKLDIA